MVTEDYQKLIILREHRDYGTLDRLLEKKWFRPYYVPVVQYQLLFPANPPSPYSALLFSSRAGVRAVSSLVRFIEKAHCFVIGEETQNALYAAGFQGTMERFLTIEAFLHHLADNNRKDIKAIHYYRGDVVKNPSLGRDIAQLGLAYGEQIVYKTSLIPEIPSSIRAVMQELSCSPKALMGYVALSSRGMGHWDDLIFYHGLAPLYRKGHLFCLSKDIAQRSKIMPQSSITVPLEPTTTSLIACIESYYKRSPSGSEYRNS